MSDIHSKNPRRRLKSIEESSKISEENKKDMKEFHRSLKKANKGRSRRDRYLSSGKVVLEYEENDFRLKNASESQIDMIDDQIEISAYYTKDYSPETKKEYRKFLRVFSKWAEFGSTEKDIDVPNKASSVSLSINEDVKDRTDPSELPSPQEIKQLCQNLPLRLRSLYLTHWDLGSRINETLRTKVGDYTKEDGKAYIYVRVNEEQSVDGSKSPRRRCRVKISAPAIDRWLEEEHPNPDDDEAYLFCRINRLEGEDEDSVTHSFRPVNYGHFNKKVKEALVGTGLSSDVRSHTVRKSRTSFFKSGLEMQEAQVDRRIGHIPGSEVTREYTRLDDSDSNNAYGEAYGEENPEDKDNEDLVPLECKECETDNAGYRDRCYKCNGLLEIKEFKEKKDSVEKARELIWEKIEEEGIAEELIKNI